jgi:hypothetical protein
MNILHHKSWHVRTRENILRVRKDEAKASAELKDKQKRVEIAESEKRLELLRSRGGSNSTRSSNLVEYSQFESSSSSSHHHVNLFEQEEQGKHNEDKNVQTECDKRAEQEKYEKKIGLLKYLVDKEDDGQQRPWLKTVGLKVDHDKEKEKEKEEEEVDLKTKIKHDPLTKFPKSKSKSHGVHKSYKKEKTSSSSSSKKTIEQLRAERLRREADERTKAIRLLASNQDDKSGQSSQANIEFDDRKRKYNNQFNPTCAR